MFNLVVAYNNRWSLCGLICFLIRYNIDTKQKAEIANRVIMPTSLSRNGSAASLFILLFFSMCLELPKQALCCFCGNGVCDPGEIIFKTNSCFLNNIPRDWISCCSLQVQSMSNECQMWSNVEHLLFL